MEAAAIWGMMYGSILILFYIKSILSKSCFAIAVATLLICLCLHGCEGSILCRDPSTQYPSQLPNAKYLIIGKVQGHGLGNAMVPFSAAYYFAAFTGREVVIYDYAAFGHICGVYMKCGFRLVSTLPLTTEDIQGGVQNAEDLTYIDYQNIIEGKRNVTARFVADHSLTPKSDWWAWYPEARACVSKLTGCTLGDILCTERHALQSLLRGPLTNVTDAELQRMQSVPSQIRHSLTILPRDHLPRFDIAIHLRSQLLAFESEKNFHAASIQPEIFNFLNSSQCLAIFEAIQQKILQLVAAYPPTRSISNHDSYHIYLASDNHLLKSRLESYLMNSTVLGVQKVHFVFSKLNSESIVVHVKNLHKISELEMRKGLFDTFFDWYMLSLSNSLIAWRKGNSLSSYAYSAQRISGNASLSNADSRTGIGTIGYLLNIDRRGRLKFDNFWLYPNIL